MSITELNSSQAFVEILYIFLKIVIITSCGAILAKKQTLKPVTTQTMYHMVEYLYLPCLLFSTFVSTFDILDAQTWFPTAILTLVFVGIELLLGVLISKFLIQDEPSIKALLNLWSAGIFDSITLSFLFLLNQILDFVGKTYPSETLGSNSCCHFKKSYCKNVKNSLSDWFSRHRFNHNHASPSEENYTDLKNIELQIRGNNSTSNTVKNTPIPSESENNSIIKLLMIIMAVAIFIGLISPIRHIFVDENSFIFRTFTETTNRCGRAVPALLLVQIGGVLFHLKKSNTSTEIKSFFSVALVKCVLLPLIGFFLLKTFLALNWIQDPIIAFQLLISLAAPMSIAPVTTSLAKKDPNVFRNLYITQYGLGLLSMASFGFWLLNDLI